MKKNNIENLIEALEVYGVNLDKLSCKEVIDITINQLEGIRKAINLNITDFAKSLGISKQRYHTIITTGAKNGTIKKYVAIAQKLQEKHSKKKSK